MTPTQTTQSPPKPNAKRSAAMGLPGLYMQRRQAGSSHEGAIDDVCHAFRYSPSDPRVEQWVAEAKRSFEEPEPEAVEEPPADNAEPVQDDPFDVLERDAQARIGVLREQQQRAAPEALSGDDPKVASELQDIESQIAAAEAELRRIGLARDEVARRDAEQAAEAERAARERAGREASALDKQVHAAALAVGQAAVALGEAIQRHSQLATRQDTARARSWGREPDRFARRGYQGAIIAGLGSAANAIDLMPGAAAGARPLAGD